MVLGPQGPGRVGRRRFFELNSSESPIDRSDGVKGVGSAGESRDPAGGTTSAREPHDRSDYQAVRDGYVSVTPLHPDLTAHDALRHLEEVVGEKDLVNG